VWHIWILSTKEHSRLPLNRHTKLTTNQNTTLLIKHLKSRTLVKKWYIPWLLKDFTSKRSEHSTSQDSHHLNDIPSLTTVIPMQAHTLNCKELNNWDYRSHTPTKNICSTLSIKSELQHHQKLHWSLRVDHKVIQKHKFTEEWSWKAISHRQKTSRVMSEYLFGHQMSRTTSSNVISQITIVVN
jgi:hypothetical protein